MLKLCVWSFLSLWKECQLRYLFKGSDADMDDTMFLVNLYLMPKDTLCIQRNAKGHEQALIYGLLGMRNRISISLTLRDNLLCCQVCRYWLQFWKSVIV